MQAAPGVSLDNKAFENNNCAELLKDVWQACLHTQISPQSRKPTILKGANLYAI
jgi:hypothetical protein